MNNIALVENRAVINGKLKTVLCRECRYSESSFLSNVSNEALIALMGKTKTVSYPKQTMILTKRDKTSLFHIILSGKVRIFSSDAKGKEITLNIQGSGTYFGEIALLKDEASSFSIVSLEKTVCAVITISDFINWLKKYPDATFSLMEGYWKK